MLRTLAEVDDELTRWATSNIPRVPTGYSAFDSVTRGGIAPGEVLTMLARSGVGKTWFLLNVLNNNPDTPAVFFSLEMHARYVLQRLAGLHMNVPTDDVEREMATSGYSEAVEQTVVDFPLLEIDDEPDRTLGDMADMLDVYSERHGVRPVLVGIDYLQLVSSFGLGGATERVGDLARAMKEFARTEDVALIVLHQVSRGETIKKKGAERGYKNEGHLPLAMSDGQYAGETQADYLMGMYRPGLDPTLDPAARAQLQNDIRLQLLKTRTGGGTFPWGVQHYWDGQTGRISEIRWLHST